MEPELQRLARGAFAAAGFPPGRTRIIRGRALQVLPRLADGGYDLVFADAPLGEYEAYTLAARRLLRPGGLVMLDNMLLDGRVLDPESGDESAATVRQLNESIAGDERVDIVLLPIADGITIARKRS